MPMLEHDVPLSRVSESFILQTAKDAQGKVLFENDVATVIEFPDSIKRKEEIPDEVRLLLVKASLNAVREGNRLLIYKVVTIDETDPAVQEAQDAFVHHEKLQEA